MSVYRTIQIEAMDRETAELLARRQLRRAEALGEIRVIRPAKRILGFDVSDGQFEADILLQGRPGKDRPWTVEELLANLRPNVGAYLRESAVSELLEILRKDPEAATTEQLIQISSISNCTRDRNLYLKGNAPNKSAYDGCIEIEHAVVEDLTYVHDIVQAARGILSTRIRK